MAGSLIVAIVRPADIAMGDGSRWPGELRLFCSPR